jgi:2-oxoisovalerate dehydrogenase E2 component (dihydrolipoyl transacylase)
MSEFTFKLPDLGEGLVEAEIAEWMVKPGDMVEEEDVICAVMTDKAAVELTAPVTGKVLSTTGEPGDMVAVGSPLIVFETTSDTSKMPANEGTAGKDSSVTVSEESIKQPNVVAPQAEPAAVVNERPTKILTSPVIRQRAREAGIDLGQVQGNGPKGRIQSADLNAFIAGNTNNAGAPASGNSEVRKQPSSAINEIKVVGLRRIIAERMATANSEVPQFNYVEECDITALESLRQHLNNQKAANEPKLTPLPFIGLALIRALAQFPQCNALYDKERNVISQYAAVHLGIATQTPSGLKVAVVKNSDTLGLEALSNEIRRISASAKDNTAKRDELMGSTITITSLGKLGGIVTAPIINQPEVGIIGVNKAVERPMVVNGQVVIRTMMNLSSSFDHRFVDGYDVAMMIQTVKGYLEQPATLFMP